MSYVEYNSRRIEIIDNKLSLRGQEINDIKEIKGLSKLTNLISLNLEENNINKIEGLENLINLENLFLSKNQITKIEGLDNLVNLKVLALGSNQTSKIKNINHLTGLKDLFLHGNNISKIQNLENFINLGRLNLSYNRKIEKIEGLQDLKNLYNLYLGSNKIKDIENLENLRKLIRIGLSANQIREIKGLENLTNLQDIDLSYNLISEIKNLDNLEKLRILKLRENRIEEIYGLENLNISSLDISNNFIREVKGLENLSDLRNINLNGNQIIDQEEFLLNRDTSIIVEYCKNKKRLTLEEIGKEENHKTEFKETYQWDILKKSKTRSLKDGITKTTCAFLNSEGGNLFIGVDDFGNIKGIERDLTLYNDESREKNKDLLHQDIKNLIKEHLSSGVINRVLIKYITLGSNEVIKVVVSPSSDPIFFKNKDFLVRNGPASIKLEGKDILDYLVNHFSYRQINEEYNLSDLVYKEKSFPKIDYDLIFNLLDMIDKEEIQYEKISSFLSGIDRQLQKISRLEEINQQDLSKFDEICKRLYLYMRNASNKEIEKRILNHLYYYRYNPQTLEILKNKCSNYFIELFEIDKSSGTLFIILDSFGYFFDKLENIIIEAIDTEN